MSEFWAHVYSNIYNSCFEKEHKFEKKIVNFLQMMIKLSN